MDTRGQERSPGGTGAWMAAPVLCPAAATQLQLLRQPHAPLAACPTTPVTGLRPPPRHPRPDPEQEAAVPWVCRRRLQELLGHVVTARRATQRSWPRASGLVRKTRARGGVGWGMKRHS